MFRKGQVVLLGDRRYLVADANEEGVVLVGVVGGGAVLDLSQETLQSMGVVRVPGYQIVCILCQSVHEVTEDSELGKRAKEREQKGYVDTMPIHPSQCPTCRKRMTEAEIPYARLSV